MAIIPTQNQYPDRAGYLGLDTDRNVLSVMSDGKMKSTSIPEGWVNVKDFGAKGDGLTNDSPSINEALQAVKTVFIPEGNYLIGNSINIPSNRTLLIDGNATLKLADNANCYIIKNEDFINGNENIYIIGLGKKPTINGNAVNQTRNYLNGAIGGYFGMGLFFNKVNNLNSHFV